MASSKDEVLIISQWKCERFSARRW